MAPLTVTSASAVDRETAWLRTSGDTLPGLLAEVGGPFDTIQAYFPRTPAAEQRALYVMRRTLRGVRFAAVRSMARHAFLLRIAWPARDGRGEAEEDQRALDEAIELVLRRVDGPPYDKTHGGRFLSAGEGLEEVTTTFTDAARTLPEVGMLLADITYTADDPETIG